MDELFKTSLSEMMEEFRNFGFSYGNRIVGGSSETQNLVTYFSFLIKCLDSIWT